MKTAFVFSLLMLCAAGAYAISVQHLATDAELSALVSDTIFVAEGRIGDRGGAATFELDLGQSTSAPAVTRQYDWLNGVVEPFSLVYDNVSGNVTFSLGGQSLVYHTPFIQFGDIFVRTRAVYAGTSVVVSDLALDGQNVGASSSATGPGLDILWISGGQLSDGFTLTGNAVFSWTGTPPGQSNLAFQIKVAKLAVIGVEDGTWGVIKALFR
ncbi:MAG: hypothetical protein C4574_05360 [Candidatus Latescibacterota bacterium]|jgi:hypothetical protein|nr:MAG: hypothetical protein C4574_05360 [Candidatus Latescibacterota bacterium]